MRVLHVTRTFDTTGGIQAHIGQLCKYSLLNDVESEVLLCRARHQVPEDAKLQVRGITTYVKRFRNLRDFLVLSGIRDLVDRYDVIHLHDYRMLDQLMHFAIARGYRKPLVISTHGGFFHTSRHRTLKQLYFRTVVPLLLKAVSSVICVSRSDFQRFRKVSRRAVLIENAFDGHELPPSAKQPGQGSKRCIYIGRISLNKRVDRLIDVFNQPILNELGARLDVVGPDIENLASGFFESCKEEPRIRYWGALDQADLAERVAAAGFFVTASQYEGFGLTVLEAMYAGKVVITGPLEPLKQIVREGETGFIVDFSDASRAAQRISEIMSLPPDKLQQIADRGQQVARTYTWENRIQNYLAEYRRVAAESE